MFVNLGTLRAQTTYETLYISAQDYMNDLRSNTASWKSSRNHEDDLVYVGEVTNGLPNGLGRTTYSDGDKYVGEFKDGEKHGQGTMTWTDGS